MPPSAEPQAKRRAPALVALLGVLIVTAVSFGAVRFTDFREEYVDLVKRSLQGAAAFKPFLCSVTRVRNEHVKLSSFIR